MALDFDGKTVWITGASSGIGAALAREWAQRGASLVLSGRDEARLSQVADGLECETLVLPFDVRDEAAMREATEKATAWKEGGVDVFVANAGVSQRSLAVDTNMAVYREIIDIDLTAQIAATQALLPHMVGRGSGRFVFISSVAGKVGVPMRTAYCAAKHGLIGYADALRAELVMSGIDVHVVTPGSVATNVSRNALEADGSARGRSDKAIDEGIPADEAATAIIDAVALNQREIVVARGMEQAMAEARRTPDQLLDQVARMVENGYVEKMQRSDT
ncbi:SDR family NAD(P)-dependent oxidoreductase [Parapontixanthobacter aurantiacus]|uniref:SDR family NAD(P)-dependent oxidoreductase n=1 Tax=Parapontixanthobacter aurantiacus TaxID=1463599 RepID=UPI0019259097|nr:SDR family NAD(P)-dependent oxidoreductase [Parapontixanthobacter aurantiacus]